MDFLLSFLNSMPGAWDRASYGVLWPSACTLHTGFWTWLT